VAAPARQWRFLRWAPLAGVVYVVLFIVGIILVDGGRPDADASPAKVIPYYQDGGHRNRVHLGTFLILIGVFFLIWFVGALRELVRSYAGDGLLAAVAGIGGAVYAALTLAGVAVEEGVYTMSDDTFHHEVYPGVIHMANDVGYMLHSAGGVGVGAMIVAVSLAALRAGAWPAWLGWLSLLAGIVSVFAFLFFPWFVIALWLLAASLGATRAFGRLSAAATTA
jgi:hypothetical protein